jgi:hypothetical protein
MNSFETARKKKYDAGAKEHNQPWDLEHINAISEAKDELLDLCNYGELMDDDIGEELMAISKFYWRLLEIKHPDTHPE